VLRWTRARSKGAKAAAVVVVLGVIASVALLSMSGGGQKTGVQTPTPAASNGPILPGTPAPGLAASSPTSPPAPGSAAPTTSGPAAKAAAPALTAPPGSSKIVHLPPNVGPRTLLSGPGSYAARCADGTVSSSPDMGRVCYGHKGVKYFIPRPSP
jgi:hypothetical protein